MSDEKNPYWPPGAEMKIVFLDPPEGPSESLPLYLGIPKHYHPQPTCVLCDRGVPARPAREGE